MRSTQAPRLGEAAALQDAHLADLHAAAQLLAAGPLALPIQPTRSAV